MSIRQINTIQRAAFFVFEKALFLYPSIHAGCADEGYRGTLKNTFEVFHNVMIDISKQIKPVFEALPKRWRVERTFSWFGDYRRLSKDFEYSADSEEKYHLHFSPAFCCLNGYENKF